MKPIGSIFDSFPLRPRLPVTGRHRILFWWDSYWHGKVTIARTQRQLDTIWRRRLVEDPDARVVQLWDATIVSPPYVAREAFAKAAFDLETHVFASWVQRMIQGYDTLKGKLPAGVKRCTRYAPNRETDVDWLREEHHGCQNCYGTRLVLPWDALYQRYIAEYRAEGGRDRSPQPKAPPEVEYDPTKPVYVAYALDSEKPWATLDTWIATVGTGYHPDFFFQGTRLPGTALKTWASKALSAAQAAHAKRERERDAEFKRDKLATAARVEKMIKSIVDLSG